MRGGEDYQFDGWSVRVLPSLHSALDGKHTVGGALAGPPALPMGFADYAEGGTFAYLVRLGGHQILLLSTANFIERELAGLRPDVAIVATGLRAEGDHAAINARVDSTSSTSAVSAPGSPQPGNSAVAPSAPAPCKIARRVRRTPRS